MCFFSVVSLLSHLSWIIMYGRFLLLSSQGLVKCKFLIRSDSDSPSIILTHSIYWLMYSCYLLTAMLNFSSEKKKKIRFIFTSGGYLYTVHKEEWGKPWHYCHYFSFLLNIWRVENIYLHKFLSTPPVTFAPRLMPAKCSDMPPSGAWGWHAMNMKSSLDSFLEIRA